jgi:hypothetical protein
MNASTRSWGRFEIHEEAVLGDDARVRDGVEHGRLAGVGVADEGHLAVTTAGATVTLHAACAVDLLEFATDGVNAVDEASTVGFELGLARSPGPDATGLLGERPARSTKSRQPVLQEGQLNLRLALGGAGVLGEDVEDHRGPVDRGAPEDLLEVALLRRREIVFEDHGVRIECETDLA